MIYRILGQVNPLATTLTDAYTVLTPVLSTVISTIVICNRSATPTAFRVSIAKNGAADSNEQYIFYDMPIAGNGIVAPTWGITLAQGDVIRVYATLATLSFGIFGAENYK
jgi:hypothetical protein